MKNWKRHLIGTIKLPIKRGLFIISETELEAELKKPLEWPNAICRCVCKKCGQVSKIDLIYAKGLLRTMEILKTLPNIPLENQEHFRNYYFEIGYCEFCRPGKLSVELKEIKRS